MKQISKKTHQTTKQHTPTQSTVSIIIGGCRGIGFELAMQLAGNSEQIIITSKRLEKAKEAAAIIRLKTGNEGITAKQLELGSLSDVKQFCDELNSSNLKIANLINTTDYSGTDKLDCSSAPNPITVNYLSNYLITESLMSKFIDNRTKIINLLSPAFNHAELNTLIELAQQPSSHFHNYCCSMLGRAMHTAVLRRELSSRNIHVHAVMPSLHKPIQHFWNQSKTFAYIATYARRYFIDTAATIKTISRLLISEAPAPANKNLLIGVKLGGLRLIQDEQKQKDLALSTDHFIQQSLEANDMIKSNTDLTRHNGFPFDSISVNQNI